MRFTLKQLRYLDAALRTGSIARAAEEMNISQSSVTAAIDLIESTMGAELFRRVPAKGIIPTRLGQEVGKRVAQFLETARVFENDMIALSGEIAGVLRLACYEPTATYVLPALLKSIALAYPDIRIELLEGDLLTISDMLTSGIVDFALTYEIFAPEGLLFEPLFEAPPWALVPAGYLRPGQTEVYLKELADKPMILLDLPGAAEYFRALFEDAGLSPQIAHSTKSSSVVRALVAAGFGYSILNICGPDERGGRPGYSALSLADNVAEPVLGIAYSPSLQQSALVRAVLETARTLVARGGFEHCRLTRSK